LTIVFTGGGTVGHVSVNLALIPHFVSDGWELHYIGSETGIERKMVEDIPNLSYHPISTGKLRRYLSVKNFTDLFRILKGILQARKILSKIKPDIIFSKGGFVSFPVVAAAKLKKVKVILHESDLTPGLANKMSMPLSDAILTTFKDTEKFIKDSDKVHFVGAIIREELKAGDRAKGLRFCGMENGKPILFIMGGSSGAQSINIAVRNNLDKLLNSFNIIHICGTGNVDSTYDFAGYRQYEFVKEELPDMLKACDLVISRAGANAIFEFLQLKKPMLLVPIPLSQSRGDQYHNAEYFKAKGYCDVLYDESLSSDEFVSKVLDVYNNRNDYLEKMEKQTEIGSVNDIISIIKSFLIDKKKPLHYN